MNKFICIIASVCLLATFTIFAESTEQRKNAIYLELAGQGALISLNYERRIEHFAFRGGGAIFLYMAGFPLGVNYLYPIGKHNIEMGICFVPLWVGPTSDYQPCTTLNIGYRYLSQNGFLFRLSFTPLITNDDIHQIDDFTKDDAVVPRGGISFGYAF